MSFVKENVNRQPIVDTVFAIVKKAKEDKEKIFRSISENAKSTSYSYVTHSLNSSDSNISESISSQLSYEYKYDTKFFTQELQTFSALAFLSPDLASFTPFSILLSKTSKSANINSKLIVSISLIGSTEPST